jgi:quinol monooxygenase YgiN
MSNPTPKITLCTYRLKPGKEPEFRQLLEKHWPTMRQLGLIAEQPAHQVFRGENDQGVYYVEVFPWKDESAMHRAHQLPEVASVWEPMGTCCTAMEFPDVEHVQI